MPWGAIGAVLAVLLAVFLIGRAWFYLVEGVLDRLKRLFGKKEPAAWHTLPPEEKKEGTEND